jgi:aminoglycoside 6'-N-acetyltransferase
VSESRCGPAGRTTCVAFEAILNEPEAAIRSCSFREDEVADQFVRAERAFVVTLDGEVVGAIQYHEEDDPMYRHAGIDVFLTPSRHGQGLGTDAIRTLARYLFERRGHHRLSIDPAADNERAILAYEAVGFAASASCGRTSAVRTAHRTTAFSWTCSRER